MLVCRDVKVGNVDLNAPGVYVTELTKEAFRSLKVILFCSSESCLHWLIMEMWQKYVLMCKASHIFLTNIDVFVKPKRSRI